MNDKVEKVAEKVPEKKLDINEYTKMFQAFSTEYKSLQMATIDSEGFPDATYATFLKSGNDFYVYVSELSKHTANLMNNGKVSLLMIEDESRAKLLFARKRITYRATAVHIKRDTEEFNDRMQDFEEKFGSFMGMMRKLQDFHLFRIKPSSGSFVAGFARAFYLEGNNVDQLRHMNDVGHSSPDKKTEKQMDAQVTS